MRYHYLFVVATVLVYITGVWSLDIVGTPLNDVYETSSVFTKVFGQRNMQSSSTPKNNTFSATTVYRPIGIASNPDGTVFVVDSGAYRVLSYNLRALNTIASGGAASGVYGQNDFESINTSPAVFDFNSWSIAVDRANNFLYVSDPTLMKILKFPISSGAISTAQPIDSISLPNSLPFGITVDQNTGDLYVADLVGNRVLKYTYPSFSSPSDVWGQVDFNSKNCNASTPGVTCFTNPSDVAIDIYGGMWVSSYGKVLFFPKNSKVSTVAFSPPVDRSENFNSIWDLSWDPTGRLLSITTGNQGYLYVLSIFFQPDGTPRTPDAVTVMGSGLQQYYPAVTGNTDCISEIDMAEWSYDSTTITTQRNELRAGVNYFPSIWISDYVHNRVVLAWPFGILPRLAIGTVDSADDSSQNHIPGFSSSASNLVPSCFTWF